MNLIIIFSIISYICSVKALVKGGSWSDIIQFTISPTSGGLLPDGTLLLWSGGYPGGYIDNSNGNYYIVIKENNKGSVNVVSPQNPAFFSGTQLFCTGTAVLPNGNILMNGGTDKRAVVEFDWKTKLFRMGASMQLERGYNSDVVTTNNQVFTVGGSWSNGNWMPPVDGEIYDGKAWTYLSNIKGQYVAGTLVNNKQVPSPDPRGGEHESDFHPWLVAYKDNKGNDMVAHLGPVQEMHAFNMKKSINGSVRNLGFRGNEKFAMWGNIAQYQPGKILKFGGNSKELSPDDPYSMATSVLMDITNLPNGGNVKVTQLPNMTYGRTYSNSIILPGGKVLIIGGQTQAKSFTDMYTVFTPELYDPIKKTFTVLNPMKVPRNYHSISFLLPSGKVISAGGNLCWECQNDGSTPDVHYDGEIYTPDYLENGLASSRPVITDVDRNGKAYALTDKIKVTTKSCGTKCTYELIRLYSSTHTVNNDQLRVPLVVQSVIKNTASVGINSVGYPFIISGYYMLFAINSLGTPSVAKIIQIKRN